MPVACRLQLRGNGCNPCNTDPASNQREAFGRPLSLERWSDRPRKAAIAGRAFLSEAPRIGQYRRVKLRNEARHLSTKAINSITNAVTAFNSPHEDGRLTAVLLQMQHAFEMLLKAGLVQHRVRVMEPESGRSIGFERCLHEARSLPAISLTDDEAGTLRAIDALRDDEQHWYAIVDEGLLYLHARAAVTLFDDLLQRIFNQRLADYLPVRVLPIGTEPPQDFSTLVKREYENIAELLRPGRRARAEAEGRIRALLAMESHVDPDSRVSSTDVRRVMKGIIEGKPSDRVFPRLSEMGAAVQGAGLTVEVRFLRNPESAAMPVRLVGDDAIDASAIRVVDLQKKYHRSAKDLAVAIGLTTSRSTALRRHLGVDDDANCAHTFSFGSQRTVRYSDNAFTRMRDALRGGIDMDAIWASHAPVRRSVPPPTCEQPGCIVRQDAAA